ncbi:MAG: tetratricopeptide repeat protein, partial [Myxococcota bacterium]
PALRRMTDWFIGVGESLLDRDDTENLALRDWLEGERPNLSELVRLHLAMPSHRVTLMRLLLLLKPAVMATGPYDAYAQQLDEALAMAGDVPPSLHAQVLQARARLCLQNDFDLGIQFLLEAESVSALATEDPWIRWDIMSLLGCTYLERPDYMEQGRAKLEETCAVLREAGESKRLARAIGQLARHHSKVGDLEASQATLEGALESLRAMGDRFGEAMILNNLAGSLKYQGKLEQALACLEQALELARTLRHRRVEALILHNLGGIHLDGGDLKQARFFLGRGIKALEEVGEFYIAVHGKSELGVICHLEGQLDQALALYRSSAEAAQELNDVKNTCIYLGRMAAALAGLGEVEEAEATLADVEGRLLGLDNPATARAVQLTVEIHRGHLDLAAGHPERAQARAQRALVALGDDTLPPDERVDMRFAQLILTEQLKRAGLSSS